MRFAYMDEKGRQVHVSSVEALEESIRQGQVDDDTELYDALEDRWGPARDHAMYVSVRDSLGDLTASAAPPGSHRPPTAPTESTPRASEADPFSMSSTRDPAGGSATSDDEAALERDWSSALKDEFLGAVPGEPAPPASLGPAMPSQPRDTAQESPPVPDPYGDLHERTAVEPPAFEPIPPSSDMEPIDGASNVFSSLDPPDVAAGEASKATSAEYSFEEPAPGSDHPFDEPARGSGHPFEDPSHNVEGNELEFEQFMPKPESAPTPVAAPKPLAPPLEPVQEATFEEAGDDFFLIDDVSVAAEEEASQQARKGKRRPTRRRGVPTMLPAVVGVAVVVLLMSLAVPRLVRLGSAMWATRGGPDVVEGTAENGELSEQLRTEAFFLAARAQSEAFSGLDSIRRNLGVEAAPPSDWMEGVYFAHAGRYPSVQSYWERYRSYLQYGQRELPRLFERSFRRQVASSAIGAGNQEKVLDLILADFSGRSEAMASPFNDLSGLAEAALDLHAFLVLKEDEIEYTPFTNSGVSRDPIVEAVPATEQTRIDMWNRLDRVTTSLETLDALDRVTTARLQTVLIDRLGAAGY